ncbi:hypothetical protein ADUPG1_005408, partial [Aduncisulcus paluster]
MTPCLLRVAGDRCPVPTKRGGYGLLAFARTTAVDAARKRDLSAAGGGEERLPAQAAVGALDSAANTLGGEFELGEPGAAAQIAHRRLRGCGQHRRLGRMCGRKRDFLPVAQFDDPSAPAYFNPNHSVAMPRNEKKPTTSVTVVT